MLLSRLGQLGSVLLIVAALSPTMAHAQEKTVTLNVENATCALCAPIVRTVLKRVPGVASVKLVENYTLSPPVTATVVFDNAVTNVEALINATTNAGYPSKLADSAGG